MQRLQQIRLALAGSALALGAGAALASAHNEAVNGDLANTSATQGSLTLSHDSLNGPLGSNPILGTFGVQNTVNDRDFLHVIVPAGFLLSALKVEAGTINGGNVSFIGLAAGNSTALPTFDTALLMGYSHFGPASVGTDILPAMGSGSGATGFTAPLPSGSYTLWIQETATGTFNYHVNLVLRPVPEPASAALLLAGLLTGGLAFRRRYFS